MRVPILHTRSEPDRQASRVAWTLGLLVALTAIASTPPNSPPPAPETPRDHYNQGTQQLREGKLRDAEANLQSAVASNNSRLQPSALYNLGQVRFRSGMEALKEMMEGGPTRGRAKSAVSRTGDAIQSADQALASDDIAAIVRAYQQGRGARKELKAALEAVKRAMDSYGAILLRWRRASGDFKSAYELRPSFEDARYNGEVVDKYIAMLIDLQSMMQMPMQDGQEAAKQLGQRMEELKKKLPNGMKPQGEGDDDEDDDDLKEKGPQGNEVEKQVRTGREMAITPEEAMRLLDSLKLDINRKLPMGDQEPTRPRERATRDW